MAEEPKVEEAEAVAVAVAVATEELPEPEPDTAVTAADKGDAPAPAPAEKAARPGMGKKGLTARFKDDPNRNLNFLVMLLSMSTIALLATTIVLATKDSQSQSESASKADLKKIDELEKEAAKLREDNEDMKKTIESATANYGDNPCEDMRPQLDNLRCLKEELDGDFAPGMDVDEIFSTGPQSGVNVTKGYQGKREVDYTPITEPYREKGLCPVNVHWHIGAEHYSVGQFDEKGDGPLDFHEGRQGFQCRYYNENTKNDEKFTKDYEWKYCIGMRVGQTYEVHWPHSTAGACNTPWQYQQPFYDGVFCKLPFEDFLKLSPQDIAHNVGVQSQTFVVVNDEDYYYPDLFRGMIVNEAKGQGVDLAIYTGSTTGTQRNNEVCSPFSPITWQVDRKCHMISASSFDRMCRQMQLQADNMKDDLYAHGSRELVKDMYAANNHQTRKLQEKKNVGPLRAGKLA